MSKVVSTVAVMQLVEAGRVGLDDPLLFAPGSAYLYSSYGTNLLQGVVETASGFAFDAYLALADLFRPPAAEMAAPRWK